MILIVCHSERRQYFPEHDKSIFVDEDAARCHVRMRIATRIATKEMAVAVRVLLAALLGLYWRSSDVDGKYRELTSTYKCLLHYSVMHYLYILYVSHGVSTKNMLTNEAPI